MNNGSNRVTHHWARETLKSASQVLNELFDTWLYGCSKVKILSYMWQRGHNALKHKPGIYYLALFRTKLTLRQTDYCFIRAIHTGCVFLKALANEKSQLCFMLRLSTDIDKKKNFHVASSILTHESLVHGARLRKSRL